MTYFQFCAVEFSSNFSFYSHATSNSLSRLRTMRRHSLQSADLLQPLQRNRIAFKSPKSAQLGFDSKRLVLDLKASNLAINADHNPSSRYDERPTHTAHNQEFSKWQQTTPQKETDSEARSSEPRAPRTTNTSTHTPFSAAKGAQSHGVPAPDKFPSAPPNPPKSAEPTASMRSSIASTRMPEVSEKPQ